MSKSVSVIFASPSTYNSGMSLVDSAWDKFVLRNQKTNLSVKKYRYNEISYMGTDTGFETIIGNEESLLEADNIVYWGDFLHMDHYHQRKAKQLSEQKLYSSFEEALEQVQKVLLLKNMSKDYKQKVISFGTNQLLDKKYSTDSYKIDDLYELIKLSAAWLPRDLYTSHLAYLIKEGNVKNTVGTDCALLFWDHLFVDGSIKRVTDRFENTRSKSKKKIAVYFGRSSERFYKLNRFAKSLASKLDAELVWVPWILREGKADKVKEKIYRLGINSSLKESELRRDSFNCLNDFDLVVTDTYHLCVNAWANDVPAICVADTISTQRSSGEMFSWNDKRHMFMQTINALDFFVHAQELDRRQRKIDRLNHLMFCLNNKEMLLGIANMIRKNANIAEKNLCDVLDLK